VSREGRLEQVEGGLWQLRFVRQLAHAPEKVWQALTEPEHQAGWLPARMEGERREGAPLRFVFEEAPDHESTGELLRWDPPGLLEYTWEGEVLRWEVRPWGGGSELTLLSRFDEVGKAARDSAGWHICLDLLEASLAGTPAPEDLAAQGPALLRRYAKLYGPEASTLGPPDWHPEAEQWQ
jgi:uncharacterized protein YndB with AHSA1/START domain